MHFKRHYVLYGLLAAVVFVAGVVVFYPQPDSVSYTPPVTVPAATSSSQQFRFEVVISDADHARGLSGRSDIPQDYGMLFVFKEPDSYGFWMKDMLTSIDIIWLSDEGVILGIEDSVAPSTYPEAFYPPVPVRLVLETRAGEALRKGWTVGTDLPLPLPYEK